MLILLRSSKAPHLICPQDFRGLSERMGACGGLCQVWPPPVRSQPGSPTRSILQCFFSFHSPCVFLQGKQHILPSHSHLYLSQLQLRCHFRFIFLKNYFHTQAVSVVAYHAETLGVLMPYTLRYLAESWHHCARVASLLSALLYNEHRIQFNALEAIARWAIVLGPDTSHRPSTASMPSIPLLEDIKKFRDLFTMGLSIVVSSLFCMFSVLWPTRPSTKVYGSIGESLWWGVGGAVRFLCYPWTGWTCVRFWLHGVSILVRLF